MYNWNTNISNWNKKSDSYQAWRLEQMINYGLDGKKIDETKLRKYWPKIKSNLDPYRARMIEYMIWEKVYSLPTNLNFWS
jgi:hypothetical protein